MLIIVSRSAGVFLLVLWFLGGAACTVGGDPGRVIMDYDGAVQDGMFVCVNEGSEACIGNIHYQCVRSGEFLQTVEEDCAERDLICIPDRWCSVCDPGAFSCVGPDVYQCNEEGTELAMVETCAVEDGLVCEDGQCKKLCDIALMNRSYVGCEFYAADLDNAAIENGRDAASQQYAVVVSNPGVARTEVVVERNDAPPGATPEIVEIARAVVPPGDLEVFELPRREVDGSSSNMQCDPTVEDSCGNGERCVCPAGRNPVCICRLEAALETCTPGPTSCGDDGFCHCPSGGPCLCFPTSGVDCRENPCPPVPVGVSDPFGVGGGALAFTCAHEGAESMCVNPSVTALNDGTHTHLSSNAYRVRSVLPIIAYQFNPLENVSVFSNDASLLLPTSALGTRYTTAGWPQTIANDDLDPDRDFDPNDDDEDLRSFLTIIGTVRETEVNIKLGSLVQRVLGAGDIPESGPGDEITVTLGAFDVLNLETAGLNADFTGSLIDASNPVAVFVGSEASDAPMFDIYENRQCCADHLEEQQYPDSSLGRTFVVALSAPRTVALNAAFVGTDSVPELAEPESIRIVAVATGMTRVETTLPVPDDIFNLREGQSETLVVRQDFEMRADQPIAVLHAASSQEAVGIEREYPGGDPFIIFVPPIEQWRQDYVFLTPNKYAFDFITVMAERETRIMLDGAPIQDSVCSVAPGDGIMRMPDDPPPVHVIYRCQLSFPDVITRGFEAVVEEGEQNDGVHTLEADRPIGLEVYGFDSFVSYGYAGGLNLTVLN